MRHCPYTCVQTHLQADHPNLSLERQECLSVFRSPLKAATKVCRYILNGRVDSFIQLISSHSLSFFFFPFDEQAVSVIHLLSSSPKSLSICPPSFRLSPCPIHSHTFSVCPLATPAAKSHDWHVGKKGRGGRRQGCKCTFIQSRCNPRPHHRGALKLPYPGAGRRGTDSRHVVKKEINGERIKSSGSSWQSNPKAHQEQRTSSPAQHCNFNPFVLNMIISVFGSSYCFPMKRWKTRASSKGIRVWWVVCN